MYVSSVEMKATQDRCGGWPETGDLSANDLSDKETRAPGIEPAICTEGSMMNATSFDSTTPSRPTSQIVKAALAGMAIACCCGGATAQETPRNLLGLGLISVPEFEGSKDQSLAPLLVGRFDLGRYGSLRLAGLSAQYNLAGPGSRWAFGPTLSMRPARDDDVEDTVVRKLRKVDSATEAGLFVEYSFSDVLAQRDRLSVGVETKGGNGSQLTWGANYQWAKMGAFQGGVDLRMTFANDKHMATYFSVDADNSTRSGLPTYTASSGLKSTAVGFTGTYDLSRQWTLIGRLSLSRLAGDAKESPVVRLRGDANATSVGLAAGYRF